ncbi:hypothetical protein T492DRAFT_919806 [Pavlovales sp. CCMP2436]|nr:hypothetical protein T492DRAFT_919806 [Pavlovales sp. CCMP2436]
MAHKKSHVGRNSKRSKSKGGTKHATQLAARDRRASLEPVAHLEPIVAPPEPDQAPADIVFTDECAPASAPRSEADALALGPPSEPAPTTEEQRDVRRMELNAAAQGALGGEGSRRNSRVRSCTPAAYREGAP